MKLLFILGSRGEWGYIKPIIDICKKKKIKYSICATNMVLLPAYGLLVDEIKKKYNVKYEIDMAIEGSNYFTMIKSLGVFFNSFVDILKKDKPNWLILAGDRGEQLMGAITAAYTYTPVAHIQGGERSGNIDGVARHAISKFCHLHFVSNKDAEKRLLKMGEEKYRVKNVGAPQIDDMLKINFNEKKIKSQIKFDYQKPYALVINHPVTEEMHLVDKQSKVLIESLNKIKITKIWILPNIDAGSEIIKKNLLELKNSDTIIYKNLSRDHYLFLLKNSKFIIGNSSSGILEAPTYKIPSINLGRRQADRVQGANVINCSYKKELILESIKKIEKKTFKKKIKLCKNPYGKGDSSIKILNILKTTFLDDRILIKKQTY